MRGLGRGRLRRGPKGWVGDWVDARGGRHRQLLSSHKEDAERILSRLIRDRDLELQGMLSEGGLERPIEDLLKAYEDDLRTRATEKSRLMRKAAVKRIQGFLKARLVKDLTPLGIQSFRVHRMNEGVSRATINEDVLAVRAMLNHAVRCGLLGLNPLANVRLLPVTDREKVRPPRALSDLECVRLLRACAELDAKGGRVPQEPFVYLLLATGARWGEAAALEWSDVDLEGQTLTLRSTKNGTMRTIPIQDGLIGRLQVLYEYGHEAGMKVLRTPQGHEWRSISNFRRYLARAQKRAGISKVTSAGHAHVHSLRHTFITRLARAGVPLQQAQYLTGHKTARVLLEVYTHLDAESTRASLLRLPPLVGSNLAEVARARLGEEPKSLQDSGGPYLTRTGDLLDVNKTGESTVGCRGDRKPAGGRGGDDLT